MKIVVLTGTLKKNLRHPQRRKRRGLEGIHMFICGAMMILLFCLMQGLRQETPIHSGINMCTSMFTSQCMCYLLSVGLSAYIFTLFISTQPSHISSSPPPDLTNEFSGYILLGNTLSYRDKHCQDDRTAFTLSIMSHQLCF